MQISEAIKLRHSVRKFNNKAIEEEKRKILLDEINNINEENDLNIQIFFDEPKCFDSLLAHYGKFSGVRNYISLVGKKSEDFQEKCGYFGEKIVLIAQTMGLNTCWVAKTHGKSAAKISTGEKEICIIALGYGENQGVARKSKDIKDVVRIDKEMPSWFEEGVKSALLAPTAMNQQKFVFEYLGGEVRAKVSGLGFYTKLDLGIVKYHFEVGSGRRLM